MPKKKGPGDYEVGYKKPPKRTRFSKDQSGNPKGRPKGRKNKGSVIREIIERKVTIGKNGKEQKVTVFEALVESMVSKALNGSINDKVKLIQLIEKHLPEKLKDMENEVSKIVIEFVDSDGYGRPADRSMWEDWHWEVHAEQVAERNKNPEVIAAWKAAGFDDEEDESKKK